MKSSFAEGKIKKICILVDNPNRDLPSAVLLASELYQNVEVIITSTAVSNYEIFRLNPDLVLLNYLRITNLPLIHDLIDAGIPYSVLDTEGGLFVKLDNGETSYTKTIPKDSRAREAVEDFFVWGTSLFEYLMKSGFYPTRALRCLGTPRMDFYHSRLANYFSSSEEKIILFNTSFPIINPKFSTIENEMEMLIQKFGYSQEYIKKMVLDLQRTLDAYISLADYLARAFPEKKIVIRPHPFESESLYLEKLKGHQNIEVKCEGVVGDWIAKSKILIHFECTTAIEASFCGVPAVSLSEFKNVREVPYIPLVTIYMDRFEEIRDLVARVYKNENIVPANIQQSLSVIEQEIYFKVDGLACQRIADVLLDSVKKQKEPSFSNYFQRLKKKLFYSIRTIGKLVYRGYVIPTGKKINEAEFSEIVFRLNQCVGTQMKFSKKLLSTSWIIKLKSQN